MRWVCVYRASGPTDGFMVRHWLERNGVDCQVRGDLLGLRGEIPMADAWPTVWVRASDETKAQSMVDAFERPVLVHPPWNCPVCSERNEANFDSCWSCQADRPTLPGAADAE